MNNKKIEELFLLSCRLQAQFETVWLPIKGYANYEVSSSGHVRNIKTKSILKAKMDNGYCRVYLCRNRVWKLKQLNRIVCCAFKINHDDKECVDHIDTNPLNNNISNLRFATRSENGMNRSKQCNNTSGVVGVCWHKPNKRWFAHIQINGKKKHLGNFKTITAAKRARIEAANKYFGSYANTKTNC
jgi:hypothetical protein